MIPFLLAAHAIGPISFDPPFVFPGERFTVSAGVPQGHALHAFQEKNVTLSARGRDPLQGYHGTATGGPAEFWFQMLSPDGSVVDAAEVPVPVAMVPRWASWPEVSGERGGVGFLIGGARRIAVVPVSGSLGVLIVDGRGELRYPQLLELDLSARSGPRRLRPFVPGYMYFGAEHITVLARPADFAAVSVVVTEDFVQATIAARFDLSGEMRIVGSPYEVTLRPGETVCFRVSWSEL